MLMSACACRTDWDGLLLFAFCQVSAKNKRISAPSDSGGICKTLIFWTNHTARTSMYQALQICIRPPFTRA